MEVKIRKRRFIAWYVVLAYMLSANSFFISLGAFDFNPGKIFVMLSIPPFVLLRWRKIIFREEDYLFFLVLAFVVLRSVVWGELKSATNFTNWIVPYLFYKVFQQYNFENEIIVVLKWVLVFWVLHCFLGLYQFWSGDYSTIFFDDVQKFKAKYASEFWFNPFGQLKLLPHGLYGYSSLLSIALVFPTYLLAVLRPAVGWAKFIFILLVYLATVFLCFSRFEILSVFLLLFFSLFAVKEGRVNTQAVVVGVFLLVFSIIFYMLSTDDQLGTASARLVSADLIDFIFVDSKTILFGVSSIDRFADQTGIDMPHNMYFYLVMSYGVLGAVPVAGYFWLKLFKYYMTNRSISACGRDLYGRINVYLFLFVFFLLFLRAFNYYIVDGYESIFLIFFVFLLLDVSAEKQKASNNKLNSA